MNKRILIFMHQLTKEQETTKDSRKNNDFLFSLWLISSPKAIIVSPVFSYSHFKRKIKHIHSFTPLLLAQKLNVYSLIA